MPKSLDNTSTGILFWKGEKLLLIERKKRNPGFSCPAGHNEGDTPEVTAKKESEEEIGFIVDTLEKRLELRIDNPCLGLGHLHHDWTIFEAIRWHGELVPGDDEVKSFFWANQDKLHALARQLEEFINQNSLSLENMEELVRATNESEEWWKNPGLEPPWYVILKQLQII